MAETVTAFSFISSSPEYTVRCGRILGSVLQPGTVVGLVGDLGSGKTCFIKGLASGLSGVSENDVTSPTFTFMQEFSGAIPLYHFDLYRIKGTGDLTDLGFDDCLYGGGATVIEWADRAEDALPPEHLMVKIEYIDETHRRFTCTAQGIKHTELMHNFKHHVGGGA